MTEKLRDLQDPVVHRLQAAFAGEEPETGLGAVLGRAAGQEPPDRAPDKLVEGLEGDTPALGYVPGAISRAFPVREGQKEAAPAAMVPGLFRWVLEMGDPATGPSLERLSPRERTILGMVEHRLTDAEIGRMLMISPHTVRVHVENILVKLGMHSRMEALGFAVEHGWLPGPEDLGRLAHEEAEGGRLIAALLQLGPDQRDVLVLRMAGGLTASEVAAVLGRTTGAVKALQHRGLARLARLLEQPEPPP